MKLFSTIFFICFSVSVIAQPTILDPCFSSGTPGTSFASVANLADVGGNSDLCQWNGTAWVGGWPGANLTKIPPVNSAGCRAIWCGSGTAWTTGGEGFGVRLSSPLVTGVTYSFSVTYVSHGTGSTGAFTPKVLTNLTGVLAGAYTVGLMPAVGINWTTNTLSFTAAAAQNGHVWLIFGTWSNLSSGFVNAFCSTCNTVVLPIELLSFEPAIQEDGSVVAQWSTASEKNNEKFIIQKSKDVIEFFDAGEIDGAGNSNEIIHYSFIDKNPLHGTSYYRLKLISTTGEIEYSELRSVSFANPSTAVLYPNPANDIINLPAKENGTVFSAENSEIEITNFVGKIILNTAYSSAIDVSQLEPGYYQVRISKNTARSFYYKFVKE